jgi:hypothetical protein
VTIVNCRSEKPVAELGGYRRQSFLIEGQQVLVNNCFAEEGMNDFAVGFCAAGPNVFLNCNAINAIGASGSFESWTSGTLYENVKIEGAALRLTYDIIRSQGGGWTAVNSIIANCTAKQLEAKGPTEAPNKIITSEKGVWLLQNEKRGIGAIISDNPSIVLPNNKTATREFTAKEIKTPANITPVSASPTLKIINGRFVIGDEVVWGGAVNDSWWMGQVSEEAALDAGISITRFVPGREGFGLTENLPELAKRIEAQGTPFYQNGPGLWYDRRRDDHTVIERTDGNVWAPFYEMPWARSGKGISWEGLSKFDLSRYNPWYFNRIKEFASLADKHRIVIYHSLYNTHNVLEIGAHWADFPWRPANNINETGLPEPPPMEPNNRLHVANQFYNTTHPNQKALHQAFILHVLKQLGNFKNIIFNVGFQYAGPLEFQQFFIETVKDWERKNKRFLRLSLATSKGITDTILANADDAKRIAVIDMRYWQYRPDGSLWAPDGGRNLAFREMIGKEFGKATDAPPPTTPEQAYRQVREYKDKYPEKAIVAWHNGVGPIPALMAGAAQVLMQNPTAGHGQGRSVDRNRFDDFVKQYLYKTLYKMLPRDGMLVDEKQNWCLADDPNKTILLYSINRPTIQLAKTFNQKQYKAIWYDPRTGKTTAVTPTIELVEGSEIKKPSSEEWLLLLVASTKD